MDSLILQRDKDCPRESGNFQSYLVFPSGNGCTYTAKQIGVFLTRIEQLWITEYAKCFNYNKEKLYGYVWRRNSKPDLWSLLITGLAWNTRIKGMALCANVMWVFNHKWWTRRKITEKIGKCVIVFLWVSIERPLTFNGRFNGHQFRCLIN